MPKFYLYPDSLDASAWSGTFADVDDPFGTPDYGTTQIAWNGTNDSEARFGLTAMPSVSSIVSATMYIFVWGQNSTVEIRGLLKSGGVTYPETYVAQSNAWITQVGAVRTVNPNTGVAWTVADLSALIAGVSAKDTGGSIDSAYCSQIVVEVDAISLPVKLGAARHRGSAQVHLRRSALPTIVGRFGLLALDRELLDYVALEHYAGPTVKDAGWGIQPWEHRLGALLSSDFDLDALEVTQTFIDLRRFLVSFRDTMASKEVPSSQDQGVLRLDPGAGRVFVRATAAWIENPAAAAQGITQIVRVADGQEKLSVIGSEECELIEPARTNSAPRSSYVNGLTGITTAGASTITADTAADHLLFEAAESPYNLKFVAGNPHTSDGSAWAAATAAFAANDRIVVSYYHKDDGGEAMAVQIVRSGGGSNYWNDSTGAWAVGPINNSMPVSSTKYARWISKIIDVGAGTPTITVVAVQPSGGTALRVNRGGHFQIELGRSATSPIVTTTAAVARAVDNLKIENFTGKVVYDPARLTGYVEVVPNFNSAEMAAGTSRFILIAYKDANNYDLLYYAEGTGFVFYRHLAGVGSSAFKAQAVTRGIVYKIGFRATGTDAEEDLTAHTISVFVNGVKGTDAVPGGAWTPGAAEYLYVGQNTTPDAATWDGGLRQLVIRPFVLADDEMVDQP